MENKIDDSLKIVKELLRMFRVERIVYLCITVICLLVLIFTTGMMLTETKSTDDYMAVAGLLGSSGGVIYTAGRLLKMWSEAIQLIHKVIGDE